MYEWNPVPFSLPNIREKVSRRSLQLLMHRHHDEQASTALRASELREAQAVTAPPPAGLSPARGTRLTLRRHLVTQLPLQPIKALTPPKQEGHLHHLWENASPERGRDRKSQPVSPASAAGNKREWARGCNAQRRKRTKTSRVDLV